MPNYIFLGPPGAGKGTLAAMLAEREGYDHISTGDILRDEMKRQSDLGRQAKGYVDSGQLVPDEVVTAIVAGRLGANAKGAILDGFPRTVRQAELLDSELDKKDMKITAAVLLEVGEDALLQRLTGRRICRECGAVYHLQNMPPEVEGVCDKCGGELYQRADDTAETVRDRLQVYETKTAPLIDFYARRGILKTIPGEADKDSNFRCLREALGK